jgi:sirohydrochlorin cobaltochelatase
MKTIVVLVMHGAPPTDFPERDMAELFGLQTRLKGVHGVESTALERRRLELDAKIRAWPRTAQNDPFYAGSLELAAHVSRATGCEVIVGFNEFCAPSLEDALDQAIARKAEKVVVITPMMTRGGEHAEVDIPAAVQAAQVQHPETPVIYAWPFKVSEVANFLATQIANLI